MGGDGEVPIVFPSSLHFREEDKEAQEESTLRGCRDEDKARPELGVSLDLSSRFSHRHKPAQRKKG